MPYASRSRALSNTKNYHKIFTLRSSDLLNFPFYAAHPAREVLQLAPSASPICPHPYLVVAPYWLLHGSHTLNQLGIFLSKKNISQSVFYQVKPGSIPRDFVNKYYYFRKRSVARFTKVHRGILRGSPVIIIVYGLHPRISFYSVYTIAYYHRT